MSDLVERLRADVAAYHKSVYDADPDKVDVMFTLDYQWTDKPHRHVGDLCRKLTEAADRIEALEAERDRLREALRKILEGGYPRPLGKPWRMDMASSKHDRCIHDEWMYETCEGCLDAFVSAALEASDGAD